uniref:Lon proteolytic domain-containing protein n=1 Tax=Globodera rostochiensis TaxID=31243 RepID=A0A914I2Q6_GLORO
MRFSVCAPPHNALLNGPSLTAAAFIGLISVASNRRVQAAYAVTANVGESGRLQKIGGLQPKTEAAIAAGQTDICIPIGNRTHWYQIDNTIRMEIRPHFVSNVRQLAEIMLV